MQLCIITHLAKRSEHMFALVMMFLRSIFTSYYSRLVLRLALQSLADDSLCDANRTTSPIF